MTDQDDPAAQINLPGVGPLREAVESVVQGGTQRKNVRADVIAGANAALANVPDGMATALLVGVNPLYGLYACIAGPIAGGLLTSTAVMVISTTSSSALAAGESLGSLTGTDREQALWLMLLMVGGFQLLFGLLRFGRLMRFVSYSVMTGFILGIAVLTVVSQLPTVTGYRPAGGSPPLQLLDVVLHVGAYHWPTVAIAGLALGFALLLPRTPVGRLANLVAVGIPSLIVIVAGLSAVQLVSDVGEIPSGLPLPALPSLSAFSVDVLAGAFAVATIAMVQAAGVSQSVPNESGRSRSTSRDFVAQGAANTASGLMGGIPVGGSLRTTALTLLSGGRTRLAPISAGLWMIAIVVAFAAPVSAIAMPTLSAVLMLAAASTVHPRDVRAVLRAGWPARIAAAATFAATLLLTIPVALGIGIVLSAVLYVYESAADISVVELARHRDGRIEERTPAKQLRSREVTVLDVYGQLFFAAARTLEKQLPEPRGSERAVVVLRLRGRARIGATLMDVLSSYADRLRQTGGRLYLSGLSPEAMERLRDGRIEGVELFEASNTRGAATDAATEAAERWLAEDGAEPQP